MKKKEEEMDWEEIPFQSGAEDKSHHNYSCQKCGFKEWIPAWIITEFAWDEKAGVMPETVCPECNGNMSYTGETEDRDAP